MPCPCATRKLEAGAGGANVFAQRGDVGAVRADAASIDWQTEKLRLLNAQAGIIEFGEAIAFDGHKPIATREVERSRRALHARFLQYDIEELVPIPAVPHCALSFPVRRNH